MKKSIIAVILAIILCFTSTAAAFSKEAPAEFTPVLRFVAASDTHVRGDDDTNENRIRKMAALAYTIADNDPAYNKLDAIVIAGDLTNSGTKDEFNKFWAALSGSMREGTRFLGVVAKNHDGYNMKRSELRDYYSSLTGNDADYHVVIGGYHFIGVSASLNDADRYDSGQLTWLKNQLDAAVAEDPGKPVFVTHHEHVRGTVYGSSKYDGWGVTDFTKILNEYPQVVDFSGHSHYPLNDPRSIWQDNFTAIGTGAIYYSEFTVEKLRKYHPEDSGETATCWIVELDKQSNVRLRGYDVLEGKLLCEEYMKNPANSENRDFTPEKRKADSAAPVFTKSAELKAVFESGKCTLKFPAATCADKGPVVLYRAAAKNKRGKTVAKTWVMPSYYRAVDEKTITTELTGFADGEYTLSVTAENAYGIQSEALTTTVKVDGESYIGSVFTRIANWFRGIKEYLTHRF